MDNRLVKAFELVAAHHSLLSEHLDAAKSLREIVLQNAYIAKQNHDITKCLEDMREIIDYLLNGIRTIEYKDMVWWLGCLRCGGKWQRGVGTCEYPRTIMSCSHPYNRETIVCPYCGIRTIYSIAFKDMSPEEQQVYAVLEKTDKQDKGQGFDGGSMSWWDT